MNIFITGATGFIGSALVRRLLLEHSSITAAVLSGEETGHVAKEVVQVVIQPLAESSDYSDVLQGMDVVIHLAARVHIMHDTSTDPLQEFRRVNLHGTERLARQAAQAGVKRFVFISTVKVHGEETERPYQENSPLAATDPYGISKAEAEAALRRIAHETGLEVVIVRPPLVYGQGVKANFRQLMTIVHRGIPLPFSSIRNKRSLISVENLVDALACCAAHPGAAGQTYLVSDNDDISTPELITRMATALGITARLFPCPTYLLRGMGQLLGKSAAVERVVGSLQADCSKIRGELGWIPPLTVSQGLQHTASWYKTTRHKCT